MSCKHEYYRPLFEHPSLYSNKNNSRPSVPISLSLTVSLYLWIEQGKKSLQKIKTCKLLQCQWSTHTRKREKALRVDCLTHSTGKSEINNKGPQSSCVRCSLPPPVPPQNNQRTEGLGKQCQGPVLVSNQLLFILYKVTIKKLQTGGGVHVFHCTDQPKVF